MWSSRRNTLFLLRLSVALVSSVEAAATKKKVCVIGAGAVGLASVKQVADHADELAVVAFEKNSDVGGLWIYSDSTDVDEHNLPIHSSVYKYLRTNGPKEIMAYPDFRNFTGEEQSSVSHETVLAYLRNYTNHFNLRKYMQFNTLVEKVMPIAGDGDWRTTTWQIKTRNLNTNKTAETTCDAVMVCNGHFFEPRIPRIPGIETFSGKVMHSHVYRKPDGFADQTVVVLGASHSGIDIGNEISELAKTVYLSHNRDKIASEQLPSNIVQVAGVVSANGSTFTLKDGSTINADSFIMCTGYKYSYPFLDKASGIHVEDNHVMPLYKHLINVEHPSMCLAGVPILGNQFAMFYVQARYFVALFRGMVQLPSRAVMLADASDLHGRPQRYAHYLGNTQWAYNDELAKAGHFEPLPSYYKRGYEIWHAIKARNVLGYKFSNLRVHENGDVEIVHPNNRTKEILRTSTPNMRN